MYLSREFNHSLNDLYSRLGHSDRTDTDMCDCSRLSIYIHVFGFMCSYVIIIAYAYVHISKSVIIVYPLVVCIHISL